MGKNRKNIMRIIGIFFIAISLISCKKEVSPALEVTVVNKIGLGVKDAWVVVSVDDANFGTINEKILQEGATDADGIVKFNFKNTAIIQITAYKNKSSTVIEDSMAVLVEMKRGRGKENLLRRTLVIRN